MASSYTQLDHIDGSHGSSLHSEHFNWDKIEEWRTYVVYLNWLDDIPETESLRAQYEPHISFSETEAEQNIITEGPEDMQAVYEHFCVHPLPHGIHTTSAEAPTPQQHVLHDDMNTGTIDVSFHTQAPHSASHAVDIPVLI